MLLRPYDVRVPPYLDPRHPCFPICSIISFLRLHGTHRSMFVSAESFNGDLSGWDVSSVTNMRCVAAPHSPCPRWILHSSTLGAAFRDVGVMCCVWLRVCSLSVLCFGYDSPVAVLFVLPHLL